MIATLQKIGLSLTEAKIYETLLEFSEASVKDISQNTSIHQRNVYDAIQRLINKGLAFPILSTKENRYCPVDPDKLLEIVKEKEINLIKALPALKEHYKRAKDIQEVNIYRGVEGYKNYMRDILRIGEDVYFIGAKLGWFDPRMASFTRQFLIQAKRKQITFHHIFDSEVKEKGLAELKELQKPYTFLSKAYRTNSTVGIFGDYVVTYTGLHLKQLDDPITVFVIRDQMLANSFKTWFNYMFSMCKEFYAA